MDSDFDKMLQELVKEYRAKYSEDSKLLENAIEDGEAVSKYSTLMKNVNQPSLTANEKLLHSIRLFYFMGYCLKYNNGIPLLEVLSDWIDNYEKRKVKNAVKSQKNLFYFLIENGVDIKILADFIEEREMIEYAIGEEKKSTGVLMRILDQIRSSTQNSTSLDIPPQENKKRKPKLNDALISFSGPEIRTKLYNELKGHFQKKEAELLEALKGKQLSELLLFPHNQNKFVELFKRLKYNGYILNTPKEINNWICSNFCFQYKKGTEKEIREFNASTVHDILTKNRNEPPKKERICVTDWLPYKSYTTRKREAEN